MQGHQWRLNPQILSLASSTLPHGHCTPNSPKLAYLILYLLSCQLITFANNLDPDQARQNVGPDLDPICLTLLWYSWKNFSKNLILKKISRRQKSMQNFPACRVNYRFSVLSALIFIHYHLFFNERFVRPWWPLLFAWLKRVPRNARMLRHMACEVLLSVESLVAQLTDMIFHPHVVRHEVAF